MTPEKLRASILQLAVQGKLVPQDPNDEPASVLLERIAAERAALVKAKKIKKEKTLPSIEEDEIPYELPNGWRWVRLGGVVELLNGDRGTNYPSKDKLSPAGTIPFISAINMENGTISKSRLLYLSSQQYDNLRAGKLIRSDVVLCIRGSLGKHCIYPFDVGAISSSLVILRSRGCVDCRYLSAYIDTPLFFTEIKKYDNGTAQPNLAANDASKFLIPLPPLAEQARIVAKIEELMPMVERYAEAKAEGDALEAALPDAFRKSVLQAAMQGHLVPQDPNDEPASVLLERIAAERAALVKAKKIKKEKPLAPIDPEEVPFDIPESWVWCRFGDLFQHSNGKQLNSSDKSGTLRKYITTSNLYWDHFDLDNLKEMPFRDEELERCTATNGDLLICEGGDVGRSAIWNESFDICLQNHVHKARPFVELCVRYFYYVLRFLKERGDVNGKGVGIKGLSSTALGNLLVPLPPLAEQARIVAEVDRLLAMGEGLKASGA